MGVFSYCIMGGLGACESPYHCLGLGFYDRVEIVNLLTLMFMYSVWSYDIIFADVCCTLLNGGVSRYNFPGGDAMMVLPPFMFNKVIYI